MIKALIIGIIGNEAHEELIRDMFVLAYNNSGGTITTADVGIRSTASLDFQAGFDYCKANNIPIMINSYTGAVNRISVAQSNYPEVTLIMAAGANSSTLVFNKPVPNVILITGGGDSDTGNETGYNIELFSNDYTTPETTPDEQDLSSFSNGYIAGQISYIANTLNCSIWEARYRAMQTGSENGTWHQINGYGFINTADAIAYNGAIPTDPFILIALQAQIEALQTENQQLQNSYTALQTENQQLQNSYTALQTENQQLQNSYTALQTENQLLITELTNKNQTIESLQAELLKYVNKQSTNNKAIDSLTITNFINDFSKNHHNIDFSNTKKQYNFTT